MCVGTYSDTQTQKRQYKKLLPNISSIHHLEHHNLYKHAKPNKTSVQVLRLVQIEETSLLAAKFGKKNFFVKEIEQFYNLKDFLCVCALIFGTRTIDLKHDRDRPFTGNL